MWHRAYSVVHGHDKDGQRTSGGTGTNEGGGRSVARVERIIDYTFQKYGLPVFLVSGYTRFSVQL